MGKLPSIIAHEVMAYGIVQDGDVTLDDMGMTMEPGTTIVKCGRTSRYYDSTDEMCKLLSNIDRSCGYAQGFVAALRAVPFEQSCEISDSALADFEDVIASIAHSTWRVRELMEVEA